MAAEHLAEIEWSHMHVAGGLPSFERTTDPAWFWEDTPGTTEGWSLVCAFTTPPSHQGNPSRASVHFLVEGAPHDRLVPGALLRMFERRTRQYSTVRILT